MATRQATYIAVQPVRGAKRARYAPGTVVKGLSAKEVQQLLALGHIVEETPGTQENLQQLQQLGGDDTGTGDGDGTGDSAGDDGTATGTGAADTTGTETQ